MTILIGVTALLIVDILVSKRNFPNMPLFVHFTNIFLEPTV